MRTPPPTLAKSAQVISQIVHVVKLLLEVKVPRFAGSLVDQPPDARQSVNVGRDTEPDEEGIHAFKLSTQRLLL
jgi:hypothetical protein